jgi:CelD/BcsL family acetyltransferase involved in cellulose biosynthesis
MMPNTLEHKSSASQSACKLECRVYSDLSQIAAMRSEWTNLLASSKSNPAFGSIEWYVASCRAQPALLPYLAVAVIGPETTCILPIALNQETGIAAFPHLENDYNDILVRDENTAHVAGLLEYVLSADAGCRQILLSKVKLDSHCVRGAARLHANPNLECYSRDMKIFHYLQLPATFDDYLASRGKLLRRNVRRALRIQDKPGFAIRELGPEDFNPVEIPEAFIRFVLVRHGERCAFRSVRAQSFARELLPALFRDGRLRAFAMFMEERMIALDLYLVSNNGLVAWNGGFAAEGERFSPGTTLIAFAVRQAIAERVQEVDFGEGDEAYKRNWTNNSYWIRELRLIRAVSQERSNGFKD